jgi:hypothetical protein
MPPPLLQDSYEPDEQSSGGLRLKPGTGGKYRDGKGLKPGDMLRNLLSGWRRLGLGQGLGLGLGLGWAGCAGCRWSAVPAAAQAAAAAARPRCLLQRSTSQGGGEAGCCAKT